jgi:hypothetical protein
MKKNKNMNTNVNDMFEVLATLIPDLVDTIMDDTNEDINKENKNRKCNYKCHCSCCDDDISLQDLLGDLPSLDELLDDSNDEDIVAKISPETNQRIKENETKIKNKTKKFLVDSPVKVTQQENRNLSENKILITANDLRNKQEKSARLFKIKNAVISIVNDKLMANSNDAEKTEISIVFNNIVFPVLKNLSIDEIKDIVEYVRIELLKNGFVVEYTTSLCLTIKW